jgi:hypothetical protein
VKYQSADVSQSVVKTAASDPPSTGSIHAARRGPRTERA